jgi:RHS repeat-associated protein
LTETSSQYAFLSGSNFTNSYTYDANSNQSGYTAPDGSTNTYSYDSLSRMTTLANSWAGSFVFSYDADSRRTQMKRPNNVVTNYTYDDRSRLVSVLHQLSGSTIDGSTYTLDSAGNRTANENWMAGATSNYTYDPIRELTQVTQGTNTTESYTYDPVGNRLSSLGISPYAYNTSNELISIPTTGYTYDYNGSLTSKTVSSNVTGYAWDYENRLSSVTLPNSGGTVSFKYDPFGRRIYKQSPNATSIFLYDGNNLIETVNSAGGLVARYAQGQNIDEPLAESRSGTVSYYEQDNVGSVTSLTTANGAIAQTYTYDSFGNVTTSSGSLTNFFRYTGRELDTETNLYYYRARYYDATIGQFSSEDPIRQLGGKSHYDYVWNDSTSLNDPTGKDPGTIVMPWIWGTVEGGSVWLGQAIGGGFAALLQMTLFAPSAGAGEDAMLNSAMESRSRGNSDPIPWPGTKDPGHCDKDPGKCNPCPPDSPYWEQPGNAHGATGGVHYHWYHWNQKPYPDCTCYPTRMDGGTPPSGGTPWSPGGPPWP